MSWTSKPIFYSNPISIKTLDKAAPLFSSILVSADKNYQNLITLQNTINTIVLKPRNSKKFLASLESLCSQFYETLEKLNKNVDEVHELYADFTDIRTGVISCLGKRRGSPVFVSIRKGDEKFTEWRGVNENLSNSKAIGNRSEFA